MSAKRAKEQYEEKRALLWVTLVPSAVMFVIGILANLPALWASGLFLSAPSLGFLLWYFVETKGRTQEIAEGHQRPTHRCRLYRTGDGLTRSAHVGRFTELWDYEEAPELHDLPEGKLWKAFSDVDPV